MLKWLKNHWKVSYREMVLILLTFAITGSLTVWLSKKTIDWFEIEIHSLPYWMTKIFIFLFGYQIIILTVGFLLGMFPFFWNYEKKILTRLRLWSFPEETLPVVERGVHRLAIFASGAGTNAQNLISYFKNHPSIKISVIVCSKPNAGVVTIAQKEGIPLLLVDKNDFYTHGYGEELKKRGITHIILAGFLLKIPEVLIQNFSGRIYNLHPSLLPAYGGKGMYGKSVHNAVLMAGEKKSGITIHVVDASYDTGPIIAQFECVVDKNDTAESLAKKIHALEHQHFPRVLEEILLCSNSSNS